MFYVYVLKSEKDGKFYTGQTSDIEKRIEWHNTGNQKSTKDRTPFKLIYSEPLNTRAEAMAREKELKSGKGRDFLRKKNII